MIKSFRILIILTWTVEGIWSETITDLVLPASATCQIIGMVAAFNNYKWIYFLLDCQFTIQKYKLKLCLHKWLEKSIQQTFKREAEIQLQSYATDLSSLLCIKFTWRWRLKSGCGEKSRADVTFSLLIWPIRNYTKASGGNHSQCIGKYHQQMA